MLTGVGDLPGKKLGLLSHVGFPTRISGVFTYGNAFVGERLRDVLQAFLSVKSYLYSACAFANTLHIILVQVNINDVLGARHLFKSFHVCVRW